MYPLLIWQDLSKFLKRFKELEMCMIYVAGTESGTFYRTQNGTETLFYLRRNTAIAFWWNIKQIAIMI